jgi:dihydrofolate reductase
MRRIVAAINLTLDGIFDHTAVDPDEEVHEHYSELLRSADVALYGRITFDLMKFWKTLVKEPSGEKAMDDFALAIDKIPKIVFSKTLKDPDWDSAELSAMDLQATAIALKEQPGKDILVGSRSLMIQLIKLNLVDELQFCIHPVLAGKGSRLFEDIHEKTMLKLVNTKKFKSGAVILFYTMGKV